jgi:hypothetical protein
MEHEASLHSAPFMLDWEQQFSNSFQFLLLSFLLSKKYITLNAKGVKENSRRKCTVFFFEKAQEYLAKCKKHKQAHKS